MPTYNNVEDYQALCSSLPTFNSPEIFGLHTNAEITYFNNSSKQMWVDLISMQKGDSSGGGEFNKDE